MGFARALGVSFFEVGFPPRRPLRSGRSAGGRSVRSRPGTSGAPWNCLNTFLHEPRNALHMALLHLLPKGEVLCGVTSLEVHRCWGCSRCGGITAMAIMAGAGDAMGTDMGTTVATAEVRAER